MQWIKNSDGCNENEFNLAEIMLRIGKKWCNLKITVREIGEVDPDK